MPFRRQEDSHESMSSTKCPNCDATVSYPAGVTERKCEYCGFVEYVQKKPPKVRKEPTPRPTAPSSPTPRAPAPARRSGGISILSVLMIIAPLGITLVYMDRVFGLDLSAIEAEYSPLETRFLETKFPVTMRNNQTLVIEDRNEVISGTAITAANNCTIIIRNSNIKADSFLSAGALPKITVDNSQIETQKDSFKLPVNAKMTVSNSSTIKSKKSVAINGDSNVDLTVENSTIEGNTNGIKIKDNGDIRVLGNSKITGVNAAIVARQNTDIEIEGGLVESPSCAISVKNNGSLALHGGTVQARIAIKARRNFNLEHGDGLIIGSTTGVKKKQLRKQKKPTNTPARSKK